MTPDKDPGQRANAIFDALNTSDAEAEAKEVADLESQVRRMTRIQEQADHRD